MAFKVGHKKVGGRKKGTPNKENKDIKNMLKAIIEEYFTSQDIRNDLNELDENKRLQIISGLMDYAIPKQKSVEHKGEVSTRGYIIGYANPDEYTSDS